MKRRVLFFLAEKSEGLYMLGMELIQMEIDTKTMPFVVWA